MKVEGECHCGSVAYEADIDPLMVGICHCSDCQALSASAFRTIAMVASDDFTLLRGRPKEYKKVADSGAQRIQAFCSECGSGLYSTSVDTGPKIFNLRVGTMRQRDKLIPQFECWRQSALDWFPELDGTTKFERNPVFE